MDLSLLPLNATIYEHGGVNENETNKEIMVIDQYKTNKVISYLKFLAGSNDRRNLCEVILGEK